MAFLLTAAALPAMATPQPRPRIAWSDRLTWGGSAAQIHSPAPGSARWVDLQLNTFDDALPPDAAAQVAAMEISQKPMTALVVDEEAAIRSANRLTDPTQKEAARRAYQQEMNNLASQAATRSVLRDLYAQDQLREQLGWFWFNHFNVQAQKRDIRAMVGDYENILRAHSLGRFRDLLEATLKHPAMLRYLDNDQNMANHINENYAREIMELHSMGVGAGYSQKDVQELARILTGVGVSLNPSPPSLPLQRRALYIRDGLFEFNPNHHDFGDKLFLGHRIRGSGFGEVEQALDLIATSPSTARHVSTQLATYFMGDQPPAAVIRKMTETWRERDGDIAAILRTMFRTAEFRQSLGRTFKDPVHYAVSAVRLMYGDKVIANAQPILGWLNRMGEGLYSHETPDGYPLSSAAWTGPGQLQVRFEIARQIGAGAPGLFKPSSALSSVPIAGAASGAMGGTMQQAMDGPARAPANIAMRASVPLLAISPLPRLQATAYYGEIAPSLGRQTRTALTQATTPQEYNALFLSSPEFMRR